MYWMVITIDADNDVGEAGVWNSAIPSALCAGNRDSEIINIRKDGKILLAEVRREPYDSDWNV
jgi:hypothetical protein